MRIAVLGLDVWGLLLEFPRGFYGRTRRRGIFFPFCGRPP